MMARRPRVVPGPPSPRRAPGEGRQRPPAPAGLQRAGLQLAAEGIAESFFSNLLACTGCCSDTRWRPGRRASTGTSRTISHQRLARAFAWLAAEPGIGVVTGEPGVGKSFDRRHLCRALPESEHPVVFRTRSRLQANSKSVICAISWQRKA